MKGHVQIGLVFFLFLIVFGLWQAMHVLIYAYSLSDELQRLTDLTAQIIYLCVSLLLIKRERIGFQEYGFRWPCGINKCIAVSMLLAFVYVTMTLFLPGSLVGFEFFPQTLSSNIPLELLAVLFTALASESVFRGYIYVNLRKVYRFLPALCISSVMFSFHRIPPLFIPNLDFTYIFESIISLFIMGIFLGCFFQRSKSLACTMTFYAVTLFLYRFTPLKAAATNQMLLLFEGISCAFLILLLHVFVVEEHATL